MVDAEGASWHQSNRGVSIYLAIYMALFFLVIVLSKLLHDRPKLASFIPEAAMIILVGMAVGLILYPFIHNDEEDAPAGDDDAMISDDLVESILSFSPTVFFVVLLPPIIFNSGYHLRISLFFRHIVPICLFACVGTALASIIFATFLQATIFLYPGAGFQPSFLELWTFGALISATDPVSTLAVFQTKQVDPHLFYLVFGESVINDAVGLVLFNALAHLIEKFQEEETNIGAELAQFVFDFGVGFAGSMLLGLLAGLGTALFFKTIDLRSTPLLELCLYVPIMYMPFVLAEICHLSGIVTVLFAGITARRYAEPNLSLGTAQNATTIFRLVAHVTETLIFLELGLSVFEMSGNGHFHAVFIALSLLGCLLSRACNIYPFTFIYNHSCCNRNRTEKYPFLSKEMNDTESDNPQAEDIQETIDDRKISWKTAHMLWFAGLRGAVSYALVRVFPHTGNEGTFVVTTMVIVLLTTFLLGGTTELALKSLAIPMHVDEVQYMKSLDRRYFLQGCLGRFEAYTLRKWVIRDFKKSEVELAIGDDAVEDMAYHEHIEMTEREHMETVEKERKVSSVYDFGHQL